MSKRDEASGHWFDQPMRWLQLNLVPDDVGGTDVAAWKAYWADARVEGLTISAAGASAFYPTDVPMHRRVAGVESRDLFGELVAAAKDLDIRVLARFEPTFTSAEVAEAHPGWLSQPHAVGDQFDLLPGMDKKAAAAFLASFSGGRPAACPNGPYFREFLPSIMTELATRYPIDGFYANGWPFNGSGPVGRASVCSCESCLAGWRARGHEELPGRDADDALWREYVEFTQVFFEDVQRSWQQHVKSIRPGLSFVCNLHGSLSSGVRWDRFGPLVDLFANDSQGRQSMELPTPGVAQHALWSASRSAAVIHALSGGRPTFHIVGAWHAGSVPLRRVAKESLELRMMLAEVVAHGSRPWCNVAGATVYDRRWIEPLGSYYRWHAGAEQYLRDQEQLAEVGIVWTPTALWDEWSDRSRAGAGPSMVLAFHGWHEALLRARVPFEVVPTHSAAAIDPARHRVLIVPSGSCIDEPTAEALVAFHAAGGGIVLGCGVLQPHQGLAGGEKLLADLAGVAVTAVPEGPSHSAYLDVAATRAHPLLAGIGDTDYLPAGRWHAIADASDGTDGAARLQPPLPFLADLAFVEEPPESRGVLTERAGCVYLGSDLDALHGGNLLPDLRVLLHNALRSAWRGAQPALSVVGPGTVDVVAWRQPRSWTVHLVNLTNPHLYGGPVDEVIPIGPQEVRLRLDPGARVAAAHLLRRGEEVPFRQDDGGTVEVTVPGIDDFEVLALDRAEQ